MKGPRAFVALVGVCSLCLAPEVQASALTKAARHMASVEALDRRLVRLEQQLQGLEDERREAQHAEARARSQQAVATVRLRRAEQVLGQRLGVISRRQPASDNVWRLGAKRLSRWLDQERLHRVLAEHDQALLREVYAQRTALTHALEVQTRALGIARHAEVARRGLRESLSQERRRRVDALERLARMDGSRSAVVAWMQAGGQQLDAALQPWQGDVAGRSVALEGQWPMDSQAAPRGEMTPEAQAHLPWPCMGRLRARFGERVELAFGTVTRQNGIDIAAPAGARVRAVARGQVVFADWLSGYGQTVIVSHPHQMHSVHAHLSHVHVHTGQGIEAHQSLGLVGDTGSMRGRVLYFELRKEGRPQDPAPWLVPLARR